MKTILRLAVFGWCACGTPSGGFCHQYDYPLPADSPSPNPTPLPTIPQLGGPNRTTETVTTVVKDSRKAFFPPLPPVYGTALVTSSPPIYRDRSAEPPDHLGDYVGDFFYPPLSTRMAGSGLDARLARRLAAYDAHRRALLNNLQNELVVVQTADPATREGELRAFARLQTPRIVALETEADQLRESFIDGGLLHPSVDWRGDRDLQRSAFGIEVVRPNLPENQILRATAYYQTGLIPEQRGLLCEMSGPAGMSSGNPSAPELFFSPEMTRLKVSGLPAELIAKLEAYTKAREALKAELRRFVARQESSSRDVRDAAFRKLADTQWPRVAELAEQAERIRQDLARLPAPPPPPLPPRIPSDLNARMEAFNAENRAFDQERVERSRSVSNLPLFEKKTAERSSAEQMTDRIAARRDLIWQTDEQFMHENADRFQALEAKLKSITAELTEFAGTHLDPTTGQPMNLKMLLRCINTADRYFEQVAREEVLYKEYRTAMLEPGLSPEQRRLLFSASRVALAQELPLGEPFPVVRLVRPGL